jgi:hypothetical protein
MAARPAQRRYNPAFSKQDLFRLGYIAERLHSRAPRSISRWSI